MYINLTGLVSIKVFICFIKHCYKDDKLKSKIYIIGQTNKLNI